MKISNSNSKIGKFQKYKRTVLFRLMSILVGVLISIFIFEIIFRILPVNEGYMREPLSKDEPILRSKRNRHFIWSKGWDFEIITTKRSNNEGFLSEFDYSTEDTLPLIGIIGDSYVEAMQVENHKTLQGLVAQELKKSYKVYNFALSGAQLSSYLVNARYAVTQFNARVLVIVIVGNDFDESILQYRKVSGFYYFSFVENNSFELVRLDYNPSLLKNFARKSAIIRYLKLNVGFLGIPTVLARNLDQQFIGNTSIDTNEKRVFNSQKAINEFLSLLPKYTGLDPSRVLLIVDGMRPDLYDPHELEIANKSYFALMRRYLIAAARNKGFEIIDLQPIFIQSFKKNRERFEFSIDNHWNAKTHEVVARQILSSATITEFRNEFEK